MAPPENEAEACVSFLVRVGAAPAATPELRREVELHLWLRRVCDDTGLADRRKSASDA